MFLKRFRSSSSLKETEIQHDEINFRRVELEHFIYELQSYHIEVDELPNISPKNFYTRRKAIFIARIVAENSILRSRFIETRSIPIETLSRDWAINRTVAHKHQKYIVAITLLLIGEYSHIQNYLQL